ncbi:MAG: TRAP transporter small permease subunit [Bacteroidota bacterium]
MTSFLQNLIRFSENLNERAGRAVSWLTTALVILVCFDVTTRYLFKTTSAWIMELEWHLFALIFLIGAGYTLKHDRHVRVDLFYARFSKRDQAWVNLLGTLIFLIPWTIILMVFSYYFALESFADKEGSPNPGGLPAWYLIKFAIVVGLFLLLLQALALAARSWLSLQQKDESPN